MLKKLKEDVEKLKKKVWINGSINRNRKPKKKPIRNSGTENYNNRNEKFTRRIQIRPVI